MECPSLVQCLLYTPASCLHSSSTCDSSYHHFILNWSFFSCQPSYEMISKNKPMWYLTLCMLIPAEALIQSFVELMTTFLLGPWTLATVCPQQHWGLSGLMSSLPLATFPVYLWTSNGKEKIMTSFFHPSGSSLLSWNWKYKVTERLLSSACK